MRVALVLALLGVAAPVAAQTASFLDDGRVWSVARDPNDRGAVTITVEGRPFHARVDQHALARGDEATLRRLGAIPIRLVSPSLGIWRVIDAHGGDGLALASRLAPIVEAIPDWILMHRARDITIPPDDARYDGQWYLDRIDIEDAWAISSGDPETTIVIVDSGCDPLHPDLEAHMDPGRDVIDGDDDPSPSAIDGSEHGTACAGLAAAVSDNTIGIAGACPECRLRCVRLLAGAQTPIPLSADIEAFQFALDVDADVVSNSWGFDEPTPIPAMLREIIEALIDTGRGGLGAIVLFASGNDDRVLQSYEIEAVRGVITVGATNNFDEATAFSNRGASVDVVAPTGTLTTDISGPGGADPTDYTSSFGGTSSSCPIAAGIAGLLVSASPESTGAEISDALISSAVQSPFAAPDEDGHDLVYGYGRVAPAAALRELLDLPEPMPDAGVMADAGALDAGVEPVDGGCGCRAGGTRSGAPMLALVALLCLLRGRSGPSSRAAGAARRSRGCRS
jgi:serine protease